MEIRRYDQVRKIMDTSWRKMPHKKDKQELTENERRKNGDYTSRLPVRRE